MNQINHLILGTAGHIDHGKTALIKGLTGVDCDRLPEEKARGITIDIGFAQLDLGEYRLGIVDVPGHERFIKNMLAGATGIDIALLVIAADDSVMPQTREHLEILKLLDVKRGIIVITKCDLVDWMRKETVVARARELTEGSFLSHAPLVCTSVTTGEGLDRLREQLKIVCDQVADNSRFPTPDSQLPFRLSIDRSFIMQGHGTVVTGSVPSGKLKVGDEVEWLPRQERVRVRGLHHHGRQVDEVHRGMRAAINLAGVDHAEVQRGQELAAPGYLLPSRTLTVRLEASAGAQRPVKHRLPVRLHIGTAEVIGVVSLLEADAVSPGQSGYAQLFLDEPVMAVWNQPFVLRDSSAESTLGGGRVLQPVAFKIARHDQENPSSWKKWVHWSPRLFALTRDDSASDRVEAVAGFRGSVGFHESDLTREAGIAPNETAALVGEMIQAGHVFEVKSHGERRFVHSKTLDEIEERVLTLLAKWQAAEPLATGHDRAKVQAQLEYVADESVLNFVIDRMIELKKLVADGRRIAGADARPKLSANQQKLMDRILAAHAEAGFQPPDPANIAPAAKLDDLYAIAVADRQLARIADGIFLHADSEAEMRRRVISALEKQPAGLTVAAIRDLLGTTRKYAVPFCEYLDRVGVTRRIGDLRVAAQDSASTGE